ncbi:MAG TPA: alanine racemase [Actinomycetota bacterium]|jgi:alanine racemase
MTEALWIEVDLGCIRRNAARMKALLAPGTLLLAVVKANAYGHGDVSCARAALEGGADWLAVARVGEAAALRAGGIEAPILLLAEPPPADAARALSLGLVPTLYTPQGLAAFAAAAEAAGREAVVHVKVDTGMHRYGVAPEDLPRMLRAVGASRVLRTGGVWSHFAVAEDVLNPFTRRQFDRFTRTLEGLGPGGNGLLRHMANSAAIMTFPDAHLDMARTGIAIYGIHPAPHLAASVPLEPALSLRARVGHVKRVRAGEAISYGQRYRLERDGTVATIPCGYADGIRRALTNAGPVLIGGRRRSIAGAVTMDHFLVDLGDEEVAPGDEVVLIGRQGAEEITAQEVADLLGTIPYEVVCGLSALIPRIYVSSAAPPPEAVSDTVADPAVAPASG